MLTAATIESDEMLRIGFLSEIAPPGGQRRRSLLSAPEFGDDDLRDAGFGEHARQALGASTALSRQVRIRRRGHAGQAPIFARQHRFDISGRVFALAYLDQCAGDPPAHFVEESVAFDDDGDE